MSKSREPEEEAREATAFFNRGRRYTADIVRENEALRSKIRRLEQTLRGAGGPGPERGTREKDAAER